MGVEIAFGAEGAGNIGALQHQARPDRSGIVQSHHIGSCRRDEDVAIRRNHVVATEFASARVVGQAAAYEDDETLKRLTNEQFAGVLASSDTQEGLTAFIEKRPPNWQGR